jgi:hypothetical protein
MNSLANYISSNIGNYMKYDIAGGGKASLVDFLKIYFSEAKGSGEERIEQDNEIRASSREAEDYYNNYISNYDNRLKDRKDHNTITLADLLPQRQYLQGRKYVQNMEHYLKNYYPKNTGDRNKDSSSKNELKLTLADLPRLDSRPTIKTFIKEHDSDY